MNTMFRNASLGMAGLFVGLTALSPAAAQTPMMTGPITVPTNQSLVGVAVGNGRVAGQSVVDVQSNGRPAVGVGALSGKQDHFGSAASVSALNDARIIGIDGAGGRNSPNNVSISNPSQAPVLSGMPH